ncbi:hypothetical protein QPK32_12265 [Massilia sp. YIM B02763]|uniref:hypothetical protein n=1 Tax=Massilia sp. YIM B02763 TaxID=3050130 RepID=UPI0025B67512|nr:hypothetical protein [Massilia sp. YIM B02763]MDN4053853.1 hypothetical protein [Massilia sp. YIM B02763]
MKPALPLLLTLLCASGAVLADDAALLACRKLDDTAARLACYDAIPANSAKVGAPRAAATAAAAAAPADPAQSFGLENVRRPEAPKLIESALVGRIDGWGPNTQFKLANGQVWRVSDGSSGMLDPVTDPKVRITRNMFGTMFIEFPGTNQTAKVKRVR